MLQKRNASDVREKDMWVIHALFWCKCQCKLTLLGGQSFDGINYHFHGVFVKKEIAEENKIASWKYLQIVEVLHYIKSYFFLTQDHHPASVCREDKGALHRAIGGGEEGGHWRSHAATRWTDTPPTCRTQRQRSQYACGYITCEQHFFERFCTDYLSSLVELG